MTRLLLVFSMGALLSTGACASGGGERASSSGDAISSRHLVSLTFDSALDVVRHLRPGWLRARGTPSIVAPGSGFAVVFVDHARYGRPESLQQVPLGQIESIRYLSPREATTYRGTGYPGGIIEVRTKRAVPR